MKSRRHTKLAVFVSAAIVTVAVFGVIILGAAFGNDTPDLPTALDLAATPEPTPATTPIPTYTFEAEYNNGLIPNLEEIWPNDLMTNTPFVARGITNEELTAMIGNEIPYTVVYLSLQQNGISDLTPLSRLRYLTHLNLNGNLIEDLSPLAYLTNLRYLDIQANFVQDLSPLAGLTNLYNLHVETTFVDDLTPLANLHGLWQLVLQGGYQRIGEELRGSQLTDISPLAALTELRVLSLTGNTVNDFTPLYGLNLWELWLSDTGATQEVIDELRVALPDTLLVY